jgi:hypothetical protein
MVAVSAVPEPRQLMRKIPIRCRFVAVTLAFMVGGCGFSTRPVEPLVAGAQRFFTLEWQAGQRGGQRLVTGYIRNDWGFAATSVRLLVEGLEPPDRLVSQRIVSLGGQLTPGTRAYFETPMPPAVTYRVRVFAFDWLQSPEMDHR